LKNLLSADLGAPLSPSPSSPLSEAQRPSAAARISSLSRVLRAADRSAAAARCSVMTLCARRRRRRSAADLARRYDRVVVTDMDLREFARALPPEEGSRGEGRDLRRRRMLAAPSELRSSIKRAFTRRGPGRYMEHDGSYRTRVCPSCGVTAAEDDPQFIISPSVRCEPCGEWRDQDEAHCRSLLAEVASAEAAIKADAPAEPVKGGRFQCRRSQREAKKVAAAAG
jgi:hypothetical protein